MKKSCRFILLASFILGLLALCWSRAQPRGEQLRLMVNGVEVHTLMSDQHNALVGHLEAAGQTNALELFRQYRCSHGADLAASKLGDTVAALEHLRKGRPDEAIQLLERHLNFYASIMCNSYGCLNPTNRARVKLESLEQALDYYAKFLQREENADLERIMNEVLRRGGKSKK